MSAASGRNKGTQRTKVITAGRQRRLAALRSATISTLSAAARRNRGPRAPRVAAAAPNSARTTPLRSPKPAQGRERAPWKSQQSPLPNPLSSTLQKRMIWSRECISTPLRVAGSNSFQWTSRITSSRTRPFRSSRCYICIMRAERRVSRLGECGAAPQEARLETRQWP